MTTIKPPHVPDYGSIALPEFCHNGKKFRACHLVLQGGGVHGAALTGFVKELEENGVRFVGIAGASAGAIVAMGMVAARRSIHDTCGDELLSLVQEVPSLSFIDGPGPVRRLLKSALAGRPLNPVSRLYSTWFAWRHILRKRGLNPGDRFENWFGQVLENRFDFSSLNELKARLEKHAGEWRNAFSPEKKGDKDPSKGVPSNPSKLLKLNVAALPIGLKFQFPEEAEIIECDPAITNPAWLVRMSMSIPYFFEPVRIRLDRDNWSKFLSPLKGTLIHESQFNRALEYEHLSIIDGGVFSNLPMYAFEEESRHIPTIAVSLLFDEDSDDALRPKPRFQRTPGRVLSEAANAFSAMKSQRDRDAWMSFWRRESRPDIYCASVDVSGHNWLDFTANQEDLLDMHRRGREAAHKFIISHLEGRSES